MTLSENVLVVFSTAASEEEAERIAKVLIGKRIAACVSMLGPIKSIYWWKNRIEESEEYLLLIKTTQDKYEELERVFKEIHSYQVPEILAVPVMNALREYVEWLREEVSKSD